MNDGLAGKPCLPTGKIEPQDWLVAPETRAVMEALGANGKEPRFIGGCVRDAVLKIPVNDIDIATPEPPETVIRLLEKAGIKAIPTGLKHGTITAVINDAKFEITTLRIDVETDGRHARVAFTDDWKADAKRRDFTINTLSANIDGDVYDPLGGLEDLGAKKVMFVGLPRQRIEEDVLRILRFFRFFATYGKPPINIEARGACRVLAPRLAELSGERIRDELFRILLGPNPADIVLMMQGEKIFDAFLPQVGNVGQLRQLSWLETSAIRIRTIQPDPVRRLAAMLDTDADGALAAAKRLALSKKQTARLIAMTDPASEIDPNAGDRSRRHMLHNLGSEQTIDLALLAWASERAINPRQPRQRTEAWINLVEAAVEWTPLSFPLKGADVIELGIAAGPEVGKRLDEVEKWWEEGDFQASRQECLERLGR